MPFACPARRHVPKTIHAGRNSIMQYTTVAAFMDYLKVRDPHQPEFAQAVHEVMESVWPFVQEHPRYADQGLLERMVEPERVIQFRWAGVDDHGRRGVNGAWGAQPGSAMGRNKAGMRFPPR